MEKRTIFQVFITAVAIFSMFFAKYSAEQKKNDSVAVMAYGNKINSGTNITFSDLAEKIETMVDGV